MYLVYSPEYIEAQGLYRNRKEIFKMFKEIANNYDVEFMDYSQDPICYDKSFFYNSQHLNAKGAELFSKKIAVEMAINELKPLCDRQ